MSLRTLLLLTLVSGCALGLIGRESREARRRAEAVEELSRAVGQLDVKYVNFWGAETGALPPGYQTSLFGEHFFQQITRAVIDQPQELPDDGHSLGDLEHLESLELRQYSAHAFTDGHAQGLARLRSLRTVSLAGARVSDVGLSYISPDNPLESLDLSRTLVGDAGLEHLAQFETLQSLDLTYTLVTDEGMAHLARLPQLKELRLGRVMVSVEGVRALSKCKSLESLHLSDLPLTGEGLAALADLPQLRRLGVGRGEFTASEIQELKTERGQNRALLRLGRPNVFWAIDRSHAPRNTPYLRWLLEHGANPNEEQGWYSAASVLAKRDAWEPLDILLQYGAVPDRLEGYGHTALSTASMHGHINSMRVLIAHGANVNPLQPPFPICSAAYGRHPQAVRLLAAHGADVNVAKPPSYAPLHLGLPDVATTETLLELGADVNYVNPSEGNTALHLVATFGDVRLTKLLLQYGADPTIENRRGDTPVDIARRKNIEEMVNLLSSQSAATR